MNDNDKVVMVPFFVAESMADRLTKANKRLWIICILLIILLVGTNVMWIWYESQFMYYEEYIKQDVETGEGDATVIGMGDINYGTSETEHTSEIQSEKNRR